jgi:hypothetical protein
MWSLGTTQLISLLVAVAAVAALCGFVASTASRRKKRRARRFFVVGFFCGLVAGGVLRGRRSDAGRLAARALSLAVSRVRLGLSP